MFFVVVYKVFVVVTTLSSNTFVVVSSGLQGFCSDYR